MSRQLISQASVRILALSTTILWVASLALAQNTNSGEIRGTVSDPSGASIPNAKVTALNLDTGVCMAN